MSFFSRLGDYFDNYRAGDASRAVTSGAENTFSALGAAWTSASNSAFGDAVGALGSQFLGPSIGPDSPLVNSVQSGVKALGVPYNYVGRGLSTLGNVGQQADANGDGADGTLVDLGAFGSIRSPGSTDLGTFLSGDAWKKAWNQSREVSFGQAFTAPDVSYLNDPAKGKAYFQDSWEGKLSSGAVDLAGNLFLDPVNLAGKSVVVARKSATELKLGDRAKALDLAAGEDIADATRSQRRSGDIIAAFNARTDGLSEAEMYHLPEFKSRQDAGALAYLYARANKIEDPLERSQAKTDIFGTALGDQASMKRLIERQAEIADEIDNLVNPPESLAGAARFSWEDGGQGVMTWGRMKPDDDVLARSAELGAEASRLADVVRMAGGTAAGKSNLKIKGTALENYRYAGRIAALDEAPIETIVPSNLGERAYRVVAGNARTRAPGYVHIKDPYQGSKALDSVLGQMRHTPGAAKRDLLSKWTAASGEQTRRQVVDAVEAQMFADAGRRYGISADAAKEFFNAAQMRRGGTISAMRERLYSGASDESLITFRDPEDDITHAFDTPLMLTQLEDSHPITDPRLLDNILSKETNRRFIERWAGAAGQKDKIANSWADGASATREVLDEKMAQLTRGWKDLALMRPAYPLRIQVDSQLRAAAYIGTAQYLMNLPKAIGAQWDYAWMNGEGEKSFKNFFKEGDYEPALKKMLMGGDEYRGWNVSVARNEEDLGVAVRQLASHGGGAADLGNTVANAELLGMRSTGNFIKVKADDPLWFDHYKRAVDQIAKSPTARKALELGDVGSLKAFVKSDSAAMREWNAVTTGAESMDLWLARVLAHVNHYLPDADLIARVDDPASTQSLFNGAGKSRRMSIHGEALSPLAEPKGYAKFLGKVRKGWYHTVADAPETILARSPVYSNAFSEYMRNAIDNLGDEGIDLVGIDEIRRSAGQYARREMSDLLFDSTDTSQLAHTMRYVSPFFSAWQDTMTKWGKLLYDKPDALVKLTKVWQAPNDAGIVVDSEGNRVDGQGVAWGPNGEKLTGSKGYRGQGQYMILPFPLFGIAGSKLRINKNSLNSVFQGEPFWLPGNGPLVAIPTNEVVKRLLPTEADDNPILRYILPFGTTNDPAYVQTLPGWARQARNAMGGTDDWSNTAAQLYAQELVRYNNGDRKSPPDQAEIKGRTRNWFYMRAFLAGTMPFSSQPSPKLQNYIDLAHDYRNRDREYRAAYADWQAAGEQGKPPPRNADEAFYNDHPDYYEMSLSLSANESGIGVSEKAWKASRAFKKEISENPKLAWFYAGADNLAPGFDSGAYNAERASGLRGRKTWTDAVADVQASKGWNRYNQGRTALNLALEQRGLTSLNQSGAEDLAAQWKQWVGQLQQSNPQWANDYGNRSTSQLLDMVTAAKKGWSKDPQFAKRQDQVALKRYLEARALVINQLNQRGTTGINAQANQDLKAQFDAYVSSLVQWSPGFEQIYNRVLETDNLTQRLPQ